MRGVIMSVCDGSAIMLTKSGDFLKVKNRNYRIGDKINTMTFGSALVRATAATAAAACIGVGSYFIPTGYVSMDINPSLVMSVNIYDKVIGVRALNSDAEALLEDANVKGLSADETIDELIRRSEKLGYFNNGDNSVILEVVPGLGNVEVDISARYGVELTVETATRDELNTAKRLNVSIAKAKAIEEYTGKNGGTVVENAEKLRNVSVKELRKKLETPTTEVAKEANELPRQNTDSVDTSNVEMPSSAETEIGVVSSISISRQGQEGGAAISQEISSNSRAARESRETAVVSTPISYGEKNETVTATNSVRASQSAAQRVAAQTTPAPSREMRSEITENIPASVETGILRGTDSDDESKTERPREIAKGDENGDSPKQKNTMADSSGEGKKGENEKETVSDVILAPGESAFDKTQENGGATENRNALLNTENSNESGKELLSGDDAEKSTSAGLSGESDSGNEDNRGNKADDSEQQKENKSNGSSIDRDKSEQTPQQQVNTENTTPKKSEAESGDKADKDAESKSESKSGDKSSANGTGVDTNPKSESHDTDNADKAEKSEESGDKNGESRNADNSETTNKSDSSDRGETTEANHESNESNKQNGSREESNSDHSERDNGGKTEGDSHESTSAQGGRQSEERGGKSESSGESGSAGERRSGGEHNAGGGEQSSGGGENGDAGPGDHAGGLE